LLAWCQPAAAQPQSWDYKSCLKDPVTVGYRKTRFRTSKITAVEANGKAVFHMQTSGRGAPASTGATCQPRWNAHPRRCWSR
jgi:hypothetical protein